jgi:hypothetical protein
MALTRLAIVDLGELSLVAALASLTRNWRVTYRLPIHYIFSSFLRNILFAYSLITPQRSGYKQPPWHRGHAALAAYRFTYLAGWMASK